MVIIRGLFFSHKQGGNLNAASRQALMQKLARVEIAPTMPEPMCVIYFVLATRPFTVHFSKCSAKPNIPQAMQSRSVLLKNMFDPEE